MGALDVGQWEDFQEKMLASRLRFISIESSKRPKLWSVTKQVGKGDVQEAYTDIQIGEEGEMTAKAIRKRELIDTGTDKRYVRRDEKGQFDESDDQGRSLAQDIKQKAKTEVKAGQGDRGDQQRK